MTEARGGHKELGKLGEHYNVINEWRSVHCTHCLIVAQLLRLTASSAMTKPSHRNPRASYSQLTVELPSASRDIPVAVGCFAVVVSVLLALCGPLLDNFILICERDTA